MVQVLTENCSIKIMFNIDKSAVSYKAPNPYSCDGQRSLFFFVDPPHLIKTVRNCWSKSGITGTRHMVVSIMMLICVRIGMAFFVLLNYVYTCRSMGSSSSGSNCGLFMTKYLGWQPPPGVYQFSPS